MRNHGTESQTALRSFCFHLGMQALREAGRTFCCAMLCCCVASTALAQPQDPPEATRLANTAAAAQNDGEYRLAAGQWEKLIEDFPQSSLVGKAHFNAGVCQVQTEQFESAISHLGSAVSLLAEDRAMMLPQSYLYLGFSQSSLGRQWLAEQPEKAKQLLTTATETLATLIRKYPEFKDNDQARFFQAGAFESLERWDRAAEAYQAMLEYDDPEFELDGIFALGFVYDQLGKFEDAAEMYRQFEEKGTEHPSLIEVQYRHGEALVQLARAEQNLGEEGKAAALMQQAATRFEKVAASNDPHWQDQALFQHASMLSRSGQHGKSASLFEAITRIQNSALSDRARVYAGRDYLKAGERDTAAVILEKAIAVPSPYAAEAAHWLAQLYLQSKQNEKAFQVADQWYQKTDDLRIKLPLMMDRGDAAYASSSRRKQARDYFLEITDSHPEHRLAPTALYNAAYTAMELGDFDDALELAERFKTSYADNDYLADVLEVEGDSRILKNQPEHAEDVFRELTKRFPRHEKSANWTLRTGLALYLQEKYDDTIAVLEPALDEFTAGAAEAEARHWIGSSQFHLSQWKQAIQQLERSFQVDAKWRRADETLLMLSRALAKDGNSEQAVKNTEQLVATFPDSPLLAEAYYRLGEHAYADSEYEAAEQHYGKVIDNHKGSEFFPYAVYGTAWSQLKQKQYETAGRTFSDLIDQFGDHILAPQALIGRGSSFRQNGQPKDAVQDLSEFLDRNPDHPKQGEALYELGLAQTDLQDWPQVAATFDRLIKLNPASKLIDRYHYEAAWAEKENKNSSAAVSHFRAIIDKTPDSSLAPEANFHIAQDAYERSEFDEAIPRYEACIAKVTNKEIREKAIYKLAWAHYKKKDYENALSRFRQQIQEFPDGSPLYADGLFMVSETLFENKQTEEAFQAYRVAKPVIMETSLSQNTQHYRLLTLLHGAQAANKLKDYQEAIQFASPLLEMDIDRAYKQDAHMELGDAQRGLKDSQKAMEHYREAAAHPGKTGARSRCMIGEIYFGQKEFDQAIDQFKLVFYGYGGNQSTDDVRPWQAFARYEAARCNYVRISSAENTQRKQKFVNESIKHFQKLVEDYPNDELADDAKKLLDKLETLR